MTRDSLLLLATIGLLCACASEDPPPAGTPDSAAARLEVVAESARKWTGLSVDDAGQLWVNYPRWSADVPISVARLDPQGDPQPFPDAAWNAWREGADPQRAWVCVQSVVVDRSNRLWVLDPGNPGFEGVVPGAPKLVRFDLPAREPAQVISFAAPAITPASYLNDVRLDLAHQRAYLTDSGAGALVVVALTSGESRRLLADHPATQAEAIELKIQGVAFDRPVHADGIAYDPEGDQLYFQALRGRTLYRVAGAALRDPALSPAELAQRVQRVAESGASDGLLFHRGRVLVSALEHDAIRAVDPRTGEVETLVSDPRIAWPDTFSARPGADHVLFTTAQIHLPEPRAPHRIFRLSLPPK